MPSKPWKQAERDAAKLFKGAKRYWANSGESVDFEGVNVVGQVKHVKRMSLEELTALAEQVDRDAGPKLKAGVVAVRIRRGRGRPSPLLIVLTAASWSLMHGDQA